MQRMLTELSRVSYRHGRTQGCHLGKSKCNEQRPAPLTPNGNTCSRRCQLHGNFSIAPAVLTAEVKPDFSWPPARQSCAAKQWWAQQEKAWRTTLGQVNVHNPLVFTAESCTPTCSDTSLQYHPVTPGYLPSLKHAPSEGGVEQKKKVVV